MFLKVKYDKDPTRDASSLEVFMNYLIFLIFYFKLFSTLNNNNL